MSVGTAPRPVIIAGFPLHVWAFAVRTWAALTAAVLAFPARSQGLEKAIFRVIALVVGLIVAIGIAAAFMQTGWLLLGVFSVWVGICVYAMGLLFCARRGRLVFQRVAGHQPIAGLRRHPDRPGGDVA